MKEAKLMQQTLQLHASLASLVEKNAIVGCFLLAQFVTPFSNKKGTLPWIFKILSLCPNLNVKSLSKSHSWHLLNIATTNFMFIVGTWGNPSLDGTIRNHLMEWLMNQKQPNHFSDPFSLNVFHNYKLLLFQVNQLHALIYGLKQFGNFKILYS